MCPMQCAVSVLDSYSTLSNHSCGCIGCWAHCKSRRDADPETGSRKLASWEDHVEVPCQYSPCDDPAGGYPPRGAAGISSTAGLNPQLPIRALARLTRHGQAFKHIKKTLSSLERPGSPLLSKLVHLQSSCLPSEIHIVCPCQDSVLPCLDTCKLHLFFNRLLQYCILLPPPKKEVMFLVRSVCLSVCLSACPSDYSQTCEWILTKFFAGLGHGSRTKWYNFGGDPDHTSDPGVQSPKTGSSVLLTNCVMPRSAEVCTLWAYSR